MPCGHGSKTVGDLRTSTVEEIWNGKLIQEVRASILEGRIHQVCESKDCPYQQTDPAFPEYEPMRDLDPEFCSAFDEAHYLETYPDVAAAVQIGVISSGLEHYFRHGSSERRNYRLRTSSKEDHRINLIAENLKERSAKMIVLQSLPTDVVLAVTTVCNLKCVMCPHGMRLIRNAAHMSVEFCVKLNAILSSASRIIISGIGEPTLAPVFWWFVDSIQLPSSTYSRANSNAHFITQESAKRLVRSHLSEISISLDAATGPTYRKIRGGRFQKALRGILNLVRARSMHGRGNLRIYVNMTLMRENLREADKLVRIAFRMGVDGVVFTQLFQFGNTPSWRVIRGEWNFVYSQQLISSCPDEVRSMLSQVTQLSESLPMAIHLRDNVAGYLNN